MKRIPLYVKTSGGMLPGISFALLMIRNKGGVQFIKDRIKHFGNIFINLLYKPEKPKPAFSS